jgi:putative ABC transport system ATP-binding protein
MNNKPAVEFKNISKTFTDSQEPTTVLHDVSLTIEQGEFVAIMGPSGSGKSTIMNIIGLLDTPTSGEYLLEGEAVEHYNDTQLARVRRNRIGFIFQTFNLLGRLNLQQNVELPMIYDRSDAKNRRQRAAHLLEQVGLGERATYRPNQVSGGQAQRAAIARALANNPAIILADEPTGNLDSRSGAEVMKILKQLHQSGTTIIMVTHDTGIAAYANRTITVKDGLIEKGGN